MARAKGLRSALRREAAGAAYRESEVARALADQVLFGTLSKGGVAKVDLADDKLVYSFAANAPRTAAPAAPVEPVS